MSVGYPARGPAAPLRRGSLAEQRLAADTAAMQQTSATGWPPTVYALPLYLREAMTAVHDGENGGKAARRFLPLSPVAAASRPRPSGPVGGILCWGSWIRYGTRARLHGGRRVRRIRNRWRCRRRRRIRGPRSRSRIWRERRWFALRRNGHGVPLQLLAFSDKDFRLRPSSTEEQSNEVPQHARGGRRSCAHSDRSKEAAK